MKVPFLDLGAAVAELRGEIDASHARVLDSGRYLLGPELRAFEDEWAAYSGARHAVGVGSGLDALTLALRALGIGNGDEVLVPTNTYIATWLAVSAVGATPVGVEPDAETHLLTADALGAAVGPGTRAVVPVHLYGHPVDLDDVGAVARRHGLAVVVDAAQAHGARGAGRPIGAAGDAVAWSFYPSKNLGALADAGAVTTDDAALAARIRRLRNYGSDVRDVHEERGVNSRPDELTAAGLRVRLRYLAEWNDRRRTNARLYLERLDGVDLGLPVVRHGTDPAWHQFVVRHRDRDRLRVALAERGVETAVHYPTPPHLQLAYDDLGLGPGSFPVAERLASEVLSLPVGPHLTEADRDHVVSSLRAATADR